MILSKEPVTKEGVVNLSYVKLCVNKTHCGPVSLSKVEARKSSKLSKAANAVKAQSNLTLSHVKNEEKEAKDNPNKSYLLIKCNTSDISEFGKDSVILFEAWNSIYKTSGTPDYMDKYDAFVKTKNQCYSQLGINTANLDEKNKPKLTKEQRAVYNNMVGPVGFTYYEYHLAFKIAGDKSFKRTLTYRSLKPLNIDSLISNLSNKANNNEGLRDLLKTKNPNNN